MTRLEAPPARWRAPGPATTVPGVRPRPATPDERALPPHRGRSEAGFSLLELLVGGLISLLVVGGILLMLQSVQETHRDQQQLIEAQQTARLALDQVERDLEVAGAGLSSLLAPLAVLAPRPDGGVDIRHNQGGMRAVLVADMAGSGAPLVVDDVSGFEDGMVAAIYDAAGRLDMVTITDVDEASGRLLHDGASHAYSVAAGTLVARVQTVSYRIEANGATFDLLRQVDGQAAQPVATNLTSIQFTYLDDALPPQPFVPVFVADQLRIRAVEVDLTVRTEDPRMNSAQPRLVTLSKRVTPRAALLSS